MQENRNSSHGLCGQKVKVCNDQEMAQSKKKVQLKKTEMGD